MARRRRWGLPTAVVATLLIGVAGGALLGRWWREPTSVPAVATVIEAPAAIQLPPEPTPEILAPIRPAPVARLSALAPVSPALLLAHIWGWSGAPDPSANQTSGFAALQSCAALRRAGPNEMEAMTLQARATMTALASASRARVAVSLLLSGDGRLSLPTLEEPLRIRVAAAADPACAAAYVASGQPQFFDLRVGGPAPWPATHQSQAGLNGALFGDLVVDLGEAAPIEGGGVAVSAQAVALYLWSDAARALSLGALGLAAPDSQDVPAASSQGAVGPAASDPIDQGGSTLGGKPVSAELARRAAQTSGVALPPISTAPRQSVETHALPPPLTR